MDLGERLMWAGALIVAGMLSIALVAGLVVLVIEAAGVSIYWGLFSGLLLTGVLLIMAAPLVGLAYDMIKKRSS